MRKALTLIAALAVLAGSVQSAPAELGMEIMQNIEDLNTSLSNHIALRDPKGSTSDAKELETLFGEVEAHCVQRGDAENAVDLSRKSRVLAQRIVTLVEARDFDNATHAATDLSRTCKTCHTFYKKE